MVEVAPQTVMVRGWAVTVTECGGGLGSNLTASAQAPELGAVSSTYPLVK